MFLEWENNSGKLQNNAINDVKQISLNHVIYIKIVTLKHLPTEKVMNSIV